MAMSVEARASTYVDRTPRPTSLDRLFFYLGL